GNKDLAVDVRVIAATNADLQDMIAKREFREDLYHRLNLLTVDIPPLRDRVHDIVALANHLLGQLSKRYQASVTEVPKEQEGFLLNYDWPGNVRELMHELERQLVWGRGEIIDFSHLVPAGGKESSPVPTEATVATSGVPKDWLQPGWQFPEEGFSLDEAINRLIQKALDQSGDNVSAAARLLGMKRDFIRYRMKAMGK
ncbi:sigma 54-interacting transcriptional regulator, partial [Verrucomicrobiales bacterium]|nr:sigma 54-interacting transcriptional regulator [Verrucomicrobiales bacterium]